MIQRKRSAVLALGAAMAMATQVDASPNGKASSDQLAAVASPAAMKLLEKRAIALSTRRGAADSFEQWPSEYWHSEGQWQETTNPP